MEGTDTSAPLITQVVGARPNFPKAAPVMAALESRGARQRLVHTGQHYDEALSESFFRDLALPRPDANLGVGSGSHARQTAALLTAIETELVSHRPTLVVVYGDINSTLAATLASAKMRIPIAHVEAGLRSFDLTMPEEINRLVTDRLADLLFTTSPEAGGNLASEGVPEERIHFVGNPMIDTLLANLDRLDSHRVREDLGIPATYAVATVHRPGNVDDPRAAGQLVTALELISAQVPIVVPLHPRGRDLLLREGLGEIPRVTVIDPLGYIEFLSLVRDARAVITDSGGIQEETTILRIPCLTLRPNTERPITISHGTNRLVDCEALPFALTEALQMRESCTGPWADGAPVPPLWDGHAGDRIAAVIEDWVHAR